MSENDVKIPEGWRKSRVKDLFVLGRGRVISEEEIRNNPGVYPVYSSQTANAGVMGYVDSYDFEGEYITWTTDGAYAGTVFHRSGKFNCTNVCGTLKKKTEDLVVKFLAYLLSTKTNRHVSYVGNPKLMNNVMAEIDLVLPKDSQEQSQIAEILFTVDEAIDETEALIQKHQRIKQGLMQDLLTKGIDEHGNIRDERTHRFKDSPLGRIPEEWEPNEISSFGRVVTGTTPSTKKREYYDGDIMFISPVDIGDNLYINETEKSLTSPGLQVSRAIPRNAVCVVCIGSTIGKMGLAGDRCATNQQINSLICDNKNDFLTIYYLCGFYLTRQLRREAGLQAVPIVNKEVFSRLEIPKIEITEQERIASILSQTDAAIEKERAFIRKLLALKQGMMQDLLTGKVRVNHLLN